MNIVETQRDYPDYIEKLIKDGYLSKRLAPIKCVYCDSENLKNVKHSFDETILVEYDRRCKDCGKLAGRWSYGLWEV